MLPQLMKDFVHLKGRQDGFNQHGSLDGAQGNPEFGLRHHKDVVPEPGFQMVFQFGQIKIGSGSFFPQRSGVVIKIQAKIENPCGRLLAIDQQVLFQQVPASRTNQQRSHIFL